RRRSRGAHAPAPRPAGRAAPVRPLGRGDACPGLVLEDPPPPRLIFAVPRDRAREALLERRARPPAGQALHLLRGTDVPVDLTRPLRHERLQRRWLSERA